MYVIPMKAHVAKLLEDYTVAFFPFENDHANAACEYIYNNYDYIDIVIVLYPSSNKIGLRTKKEINLGKLVKKYWGDNAGGHPAAAWATISKVEMLGMMSSYLINSETLADYDKRVKGGDECGDEIMLNNITCMIIITVILFSGFSFIIIILGKAIYAYIIKDTNNNN